MGVAVAVGGRGRRGRGRGRFRVRGRGRGIGAFAIMQQKRQSLETPAKTHTRTHKTRNILGNVWEDFWCLGGNLAKIQGAHNKFAGSLGSIQPRMQKQRESLEKHNGTL